MSAAGFTGEGRFSYQGDEYIITLNNMALIEAEGVLGESMLTFIPLVHEQIENGQNPQVRHMAAIIFGGLKVNHKYITQEVVVDMVMARDAGMMKALMTAMQGLDIPDEGGNAAAPAKGARRGPTQRKRAAAK